MKVRFKQRRYIKLRNKWYEHSYKYKQRETNRQTDRQTNLGVTTFWLSLM